MERFSIQNISGRYFQEISMEIRRGDCYALVGRDGEGKTSVLNAVLGMQKLYAGSVLMDGERLNRKKWQQSIGYVPDDLLCFEHMTGAALLDMTISLRRPEDDIEKAEELIDYFGVNPGLLLEEMNDDMNKCVYLISAFLAEPEILILDEPFNFLEEDSRIRLKKWLRNYAGKGHAVLLTHDDFDEIADVCNRFSAVKERVQICRDEETADYPLRKRLTLRERDGCFQYIGFGEEVKAMTAVLDGADFIVEDVTGQEQVFEWYPWKEAGVWRSQDMS